MTSTAQPPIPANAPKFIPGHLPPRHFPEPDTSCFEPAPPSPQGGRPTKLSPEVALEIAHFIRTDGCSDSMAGVLAGVSSSTLSRWKQDNEEFAFLLEQSRAQFEVNRLRAIGNTTMRDGQMNWRAQAWLLQQSSPETYGPPSRRRSAKATEQARTENSSALVVSPEQLQQLQERRRQVLEKMEGSSTGVPPVGGESPAGVSARREAQAGEMPAVPYPPTGKMPVPQPTSWQNVTILPETSDAPEDRGGMTEE